MGIEKYIYIHAAVEHNISREKLNAYKQYNDNSFVMYTTSWINCHFRAKVKIKWFSVVCLFYCYYFCSLILHSLCNRKFLCCICNVTDWMACERSTSQLNQPSTNNCTNSLFNSLSIVICKYKKLVKFFWTEYFH